MRKYHLLVIVGLVGAIIACSMVKTRDEAKEDAKIQAAEAENAPLPPGPVLSENETGENLDQPAPVPIGETPSPSDDPVLDEELSKMGIDPNDPNGATKTPEPGAAPKTTPLHKRTVFKQAAKKAVSKTNAKSIKGKKAGKAAKSAKTAKSGKITKDSKLAKKKKPVKPKPQAG